MAEYGTSERKYYVECPGNPNHAGNQWRYNDEKRPDRCATCGGPVEATLIEADGERMISEEPDEPGDEGHGHTCPYCGGSFSCCCSNPGQETADCGGCKLDDVSDN